MTTSETHFPAHLQRKSLPKSISQETTAGVNAMVILLIVIGIIGLIIASLGALCLGGVNVSFLSSIDKLDAILMVAIAGGAALISFAVIGVLKIIEKFNAAKTISSELSPAIDDPQPPYSKNDEDASSSKHISTETPDDQSENTNAPSSTETSDNQSSGKLNAAKKISSELSLTQLPQSQKISTKISDKQSDGVPVPTNPLISSLSSQHSIRDLTVASCQQVLPIAVNEPIPLAHLIAGPGGGKMAEDLSAHWLKDAATRIFKNRLRSFLELVVNALDASLPEEKSVGKFGLGFISILTFLDHPETHGCTIQIETTTKNKDRTLSAYSMDLFKEKGTYQVLFTDKEPQASTGTLITIRPTVNSFSDDTLLTLLHDCMTLEFYEHGRIEMIHKGTQYTVGEGENVLAWVSLTEDQISVCDHGCGISKEVAQTKLFVPSASTKNNKKFSKIPPVTLPEFKKYANNQTQQPSFLISINGVIVIDLPFEGPTNLLLKMPPSTRLTVARDAIENRPDTIHYLKEVIVATLKNATSNENSALLLALYNGLKKWESQVPSMADAKLVAYLHTCVQELFQQNPDLIPFPLEHVDALQPLLPNDKKLFPFPSVLLFDYFSSFENFIKKQCDKKSDDLISGKTVVFIKGIDKISAFGMRNLLFAPISLLDDNLSKEILQLALVTQFADPGKFLEAVPSNQNSALPASLANLRGPKQFVFLTGRNTSPTFDENIILASHHLFDDAEDAPFVEFWEKFQQSVSEHIFGQGKRIEQNVILPALITKEEPFFELLGWGAASDYIAKSALETLIVSDGQNYWIVNDVDAALNFIKVEDSIIPTEAYYPNYYFMRSKTLAATLVKSEFKTKFLHPISIAELSKFYFKWLFKQLGVSGTAGAVFTAEKTLWPTQSMTVDLLESYFQIFIKKKTPIIADSTLPPLHKQGGMWKTLESFMDYKENGILAIQKVVPLLQLQEQMLNDAMPLQLQEKLILSVKQLLCMYHQFLTIKEEDIDAAYGLSLPRFNNCHRNHSEFECPLEELIDLFNSMRDKPALFEKCLDLLTQEMSERLSLKERNKLLAQNYSPILVDVSFNNCISLLSIAKAKGIDQTFIEIILYHAKKPFELYLVSLLLLSKKLYGQFSQSQDKEKLTSILAHIVTIYFGKIDLKQWEEQNISFWWYENIEDVINKTFRLVLEPLVNYLTEAKGTSFEIDPKMIPAHINHELESAPYFTTIQVIHAAKKGEAFSGALQKSDLQEAITQISKESQQTDLQIVTQAIEHGSERSSIESTLIEAFQNSVDAVRGFLKKNPQAPQEKATISFDVRLVDANQPQLLLEVADQIGMESLETLLADFLIPNYSKKSKRGDTVGEMGNGSYQMYRDAEMVTVQTRTLGDPSRVYFLRIIPIRDPETGEVTDLRHKCIDITNSPERISFAGTTLRVLMKSPPDTPKTAIELEGLVVRHFIKQTFSVAVPPLENQQHLACILKLPKGDVIPLDDILSRPPFTIKNAPFSCYKMRTDMNPGYVLTDGYPFKSLETFLVEEKLLPADLAAEMGQGWCLNLPKGTYEPVQSRTHVCIDPQVKKNLQLFLLEWIYYRSFDIESLKPGRHYYPHFRSEADFSQVYPGVIKLPDLADAVLNQGDFRSLESFFVHYIPTFLQRSFLDYIDDGYKNLITSLNTCKENLLKAFEKQLTSGKCKKLYHKLSAQFLKDCDTIKKKWIESLNPNNEVERTFIERVVVLWFSKKIESFTDTVPTLQQLKAINPQLKTNTEINAASAAEAIVQHDLDIPHLLYSAATILNHYCELHFTKNSLNKQAPKVRFFYESTHPANAYYDHTTHEISINLANISLCSILEIGKKLSEKFPPHHALISISNGSSGILNHELEHARRGHSCNGNAHGYDINVEGAYVNFEACAASYGRNAYEKGLVVEWSQTIQNLPLPSVEQLSKLHTIEEKHPNILTKACSS